jgi:hypothetical protein
MRSAGEETLNVSCWYGKIEKDKKVAAAKTARCVQSKSVNDDMAKKHKGGGILCWQPLKPKQMWSVT